MLTHFEGKSAISASRISVCAMGDLPVIEENDEGTWHLYLAPSTFGPRAQPTRQRYM
jgi:hypothetical protein